MSPKRSLACAGAFAVAATLAGLSPALSHTIVGNRVFPATLTIDDPGENDELTLPMFVYTAAENPDGTLGPLTYTFGWFYGKTIFYNLEVSVFSTGFIHQVNPFANGWGNINTELKYGLYQNAEHEFIVSTALDVAWGNTGSGFNSPVLSPPPSRFTDITAKVFVGKGFGDVEADWIKPFAVTGEIDYTWSTHPFDVTGVDQFGNVLFSQMPTLLTYGATLQYSLLYMNSFVHEVPEFFRQLIPTFEVIFTSPVSNIGPSTPLIPTHVTTGTYGPSLYYFGRIGPITYEAGVTAQFPINPASGKHVGAIAFVDFLLDDMFPNSIGKPLFGPSGPRGAGY
jgi:hypothetical protein